MKRVLLFLFFLAASYSTFAQSYVVKRRVPVDRYLRLGFTISPGLASLGPQDAGADRESMHGSITYGLMADFILDTYGRYAFSTGFTVNTGGSTMKYAANKGLSDYRLTPAEYDLHLSYIDIPLAIKLKTVRQDGIDIYGEFGTFLDFNIKARADITDAQDHAFDKVNVMKDIAPINTGLALGGGIEYPLDGRLSLVAGLQYKAGLIDVTRNSRWDDGRVVRNNFVLKLGLFF
ncbi:porin family protein [Chitinophaga parva]|nr:porin family protein [Chitinophaga parva]